MALRAGKIVRFFHGLWLHVSTVSANRAGLVRRLGQRFGQGFVQDFASARGGNFTISFALLLLPLVVGIGVSIDYIRAFNAKDRLQGDLDAAMLSTVKDYNSSTDAQLTSNISTWLGDQAESSDYTVGTISIDRTDYTISSTATGNVPTYFMSMFGTTQIPISVTSKALGPGTYYLNVYLLLDTSASEDLAADTAGQATMRSKISCEFGCHTGDVHTVNGVSYANNNAYATAAAITQRNAVLINAAKGVIAAVDAVDPTHKRIKVGVYFLNTTTTQILAPTFTTSSAITALSSTTSTSVDGTAFDTSLTAMASLAGSSGDGKTATTPKKFVMMVTDGVQSKRAWVTRTSSSASSCTKWSGNLCIGYPMSSVALNVAPLNPDWCNYLKNKGITTSVLYTTYLPVTLDWGYNGTLGATMPSTWSGTVKSGTSSTITRQAYLPIALQQCASASSLYMEAASSSDITASMTTLFQKYENLIRLVQ